MSRYPKYLPPIDELLMEYCLIVSGPHTRVQGKQAINILKHLNDYLGGFESHHRIAETMEIVRMIIPKPEG